MSGSVSSFYLNSLAERRDDLVSRAKELMAYAEFVEKRLNARHPELSPTVFCSMERLDTALASYFYDIHRYKHFHDMLGGEAGDPISRVNYAKVYAFTAKWFLKEKPFYVAISKELVGRVPLPENYIKHANFLNETVFLLWMKASFRALMNKELTLNEKEHYKLLYTLKYREISTAIFELFLLGKADFPVGVEGGCMNNLKV